MLTALLLAATSASAPPSAPPQASAPAESIAPRRIRTAEMIADVHLPATGRPAPAILMLGGSEGGLRDGGQARLLAARGYVVLHLSYFGSPGQTPTLKLIPLETFTRAIDWLKAQPEVIADRIGIVGNSKGAEAALLVAARRPELRIAVLGVPSSVSWPGIDMASVVTDSSWSEGGRPVPATPYGWTGQWKGIHALYADGLADPAAAGRGEIAAERVGGRIVMVCGEKDNLWPSCPMARAVEARLKARRFRHPVTVLAYPAAGHAAFGPPIAADAIDATVLEFLGGSIEGTMAARADGWPKVLAALDAALQPGARR